MRDPARPDSTAIDAALDDVVRVVENGGGRAIVHVPPCPRDDLAEMAAHLVLRLAALPRQP